LSETHNPACIRQRDVPETLFSSTESTYFPNLLHTSASQANMRVREAISGLGAVLLATAAGNSEHYMFTAGALLLAYAALLPGVVMQRDPQNEHATIFSWGAGQVVTGRVANKKRKR
jgi:hypothetical protein